MSGPTDPATVLSVPLKQRVQRKEDGLYVTVSLDIVFSEDTLSKGMSDVSDHMKWIATQYPDHAPHDMAYMTTGRVEGGDNLLTLEGSMMLKPIVVK